MSTPQVPAGSVVVGIDGSPWSDGAIDWAADQAVLEQRSLTVVHAIPPMGLDAAGGFDYEPYREDGRSYGQVLLDDAVARAREGRPELRVQDVLRVSDPRNLLLALGEHAAMIVVGSRGRGPVASLLLGSVSVSVSKHASCPVVVRGGDAGPTAPVRRILVGVDGTERTLPAIEFAYRMASVRESSLTVLHCYWTSTPVAPLPGREPLPDLSAERALVSESLAGMAEKFPEVEVTVHLVAGFADHRLTAAAADHDLIVVGHRRSGYLRDLVHDSVASAVLEHAHGCVAVVPSHSAATTASADA